MIDLLSVGVACFLFGIIVEMLMNEYKGTTDIKVRCENLTLKKELEETKKELATYKHYWFVKQMKEELNVDGDVE